MSKHTAINAQSDQIVLASSSPYRMQQLAERLGLHVLAMAPKVDETPLAKESAYETALRLSKLKAQSVSNGLKTRAIIIAGDQTAQWREQRLSKPGSREQAIEQLSQFSNEHVVFYSGVCVFDTRHQTMHTDIVETKVRFRALDTQQISRYVDYDRPWDCVGAFKNEARGIALFRSIESTDPSALTGLPLISLCSMLAKCDIQVL